MVVVNGRFLIHRVTGVERYAREILAELDKIIEPGEVIMAIPPETKEIPDYKNIRVERVGKLHNRLWEHISFPAYVRRRKGISLNLCNTAPLPDPGIVCIHDMKIKARPQDFNILFLIWYRLLFFNACKRAKKIITVSEFSKNEIIKYYKVPRERIIVVPNAWQHFEKTGFDEKTLERYELRKGDYYFSVSSLEPNKNLKWIVEAAKADREQVFVVAGADNREIFADGLKSECPPNIKMLGYISDEEVKTLMRDCKAFLYPSFYEGFGIPPLEAISAGASTIVVSDIPVMHEIFGGDVNYINPLRPDFAHKEYKRTGQDVLKMYSWRDNSAPILRTVIRSHFVSDRAIK